MPERRATPSHSVQHQSAVEAERRLGKAQGLAVLPHRSGDNLSIPLQLLRGELQCRAIGTHSSQHQVPVGPQLWRGKLQGYAVLPHGQERDLAVAPELLRSEAQHRAVLQERGREESSVLQEDLAPVRRRRSVSDERLCYLDRHRARVVAPGAGLVDGLQRAVRQDPAPDLVERLVPVRLYAHQTHGPGVARQQVGNVFAAQRAPLPEEPGLRAWHAGRLRHGLIHQPSVPPGICRHLAEHIAGEALHHSQHWALCLQELVLRQDFMTTVLWRGLLSPRPAGRHTLPGRPRRRQSHG
mmetsp:Transcript_41936/g.125419  ORF Transcript_41936/g.125419 Transcript_41936/m.125419 type:complete len:297 (+) Transcript_41936:258-1148(+)